MFSHQTPVKAKPSVSDSHVLSGDTYRMHNINNWIYGGDALASFLRSHGVMFCVDVAKME